MSKTNNILAFIICLLFLLPLVSNAQNEVSSPYSGFGVGVVNSGTPAALMSLAGTSYAIQNPYLINFKNPASYVAFDSLSFIADASFSVVNNTLKTTDASQKSTVARPNYLVIGLPVTKHWRTSAGILPYSDIGYVVVDNHNVAEFGNVNYTYKGDGGLMQLYWGNAFSICKGLSLGLNVSYMWGRMTYKRSVEIDGTQFFNTTIDNSVHVDGIYLSGGLQYFNDINENHRIGLGVVYENSAYLWAKDNQLITIFEGTLSNVTGEDTLVSTVNRRGSMQMPQCVGGGVSYSYKKRLLVAADVTWQNWEKYRLMGESDSLTNAIVTSLGIQYTPDPQSAHYGKKIAIRAGAKYSTGYFSFKGEPVSEYSFSFGLGFPLKGANSNSSLNVLLEYGKMGNLTRNDITESYWKLTLSFILQEKWYQRVKLD